MLKQKWGKGKSKDKLENKTFLSKPEFEAIEKGISKMKLISVSILHDKYKCIGSISRRLIKHFEAAGKIRRYAPGNANQYLYTGVDVGKEEVKAEVTTKGKAATAKQPKAAK
jgi:ribosomal protein S25